MRLKTPLLLPMLLLAAAASTAAPAADQASHSPRGRWISSNGNLEVEIAPCGNALCGTVVRVMGNRSMSPSAAAADAPAKPIDTRPTLGLRVLSGFVLSKSAPFSDPPADFRGTGPGELSGEHDAASSSEWQGEIFNRENGKSYRCRMRVSTDSNPAGELLLRVYIGLPLFGQTQRWQRAEAAGRPEQP